MLITTSIRRAIAYGQESPETREVYYTVNGNGVWRYYVSNEGDTAPDARVLRDWRGVKL